MRVKSAQVVETSVSVTTNGPCPSGLHSQGRYIHHPQGMTPRLKPVTMN